MAAEDGSGATTAWPGTPQSVEMCVPNMQIFWGQFRPGALRAGPRGRRSPPGSPKLGDFGVVYVGSRPRGEEALRMPQERRPAAGVGLSMGAPHGAVRGEG